MESELWGTRPPYNHACHTNNHHHPRKSRGINQYPLPKAARITHRTQSTPLAEKPHIDPKITSESHAPHERARVGVALQAVLQDARAEKNIVI